jgi:4-amino-4-deoxy-L-arabinose transferase-like glycosyltransferase
MLKKKEFWILLLIMAVGIFFRFYLIKQMPGGLFPDEAADGLDVNNLLHGHLLAFYPRANGREALFQYLLAASVHFFGRGPWQHHIVSATIGVISIFSTYLMAKRFFGIRTALVAAFLMATSTWHIVLSRTAFRAIMVPMFETLTLYFIARVIQAKTKKDMYWSAAFLGIFFFGGFYSYIAYRILPVILLVLLALGLIADARQKFVWTKKFWKATVLALVTGLATFAPLGWYFYKNPGSFTGRAGQVSIFNPQLNGGHLIATFIQILKTALEAYFMHGDLNWRQNISGNAFLSPMISPFFALAMLIAIYFSVKFIIQVFRNRQNNDHWKYLAMVGLFFGFLIPEVTAAEGIPHGLRSIGTTVPAYVLAAVGLILVWDWMQKVWHPKFIGYLYKLVAVLFFGVLMFTSYEAYFVYAFNNPDNFAAFRSDLTAVSAYLNSHPDRAHNYLVLDLYSAQTVDYFTTTTGNPYTIIDPENSTSLHLKPGDKLIYTASTIYDYDRYALNHSNYTESLVQDDKFGSPEMIVLTITKADSGGYSISRTADGEFTAINFGNRIDFEWAVLLPWQPWHIDFYQCTNSSCANKTQIKEDNQNDYFSNKDYIITDGTKSNLYYEAIGYDQNNNILKNYGPVTVLKY